MSISHQNIDKWLFEYCEGNLNPTQQEQLFDFLEDHPEYAEDLDAWKDTYITEPVPEFAEAEALMVSETVAWKRLAVASLLLLLIGGGAALMINGYNTNSSENFTAGGLPVDDNSNTFSNASNTTFNNNGDALSTTHSSGSLPSNHSPYLVSSNSGTLQTHTPNNASPFVQRNNGVDGSTEDKTFSQNGQNLLIHQSDGNAEDIVMLARNEETLSDQNAENEELNSDKSISARDRNYVPWQFTRVSDLNPDYLMSKPINRPEPRSGQGHVDSKTGKGLEPTNLYQHDLLRPVMFSFQQNASFSGELRQLEGYTSMRARWVSTDHSAYEFTAGFQDYNRKWKSAYGFYAQHTSYYNGGINLTSANAFFSPKFKMDRYTWIEPSISLSYTYTTISPRLFNQEKQLELYEGQAYATQMNVMKSGSGYVNAHAGVQLQTRKMYATIGVGNLGRPNVSYLNNENSNPYYLPMSIDMTVGTDFRSVRHPEVSVSPQAVLVAQGTYNRVWAGARLKLDNIYVGASASYKGELFASAGIRTQIGTFAYKFDWSQSALMQQKKMSHGITASLNLRSFGQKVQPYLNY